MARGNIKRNKSVDRQKVVHTFLWLSFSSVYFHNFIPPLFADAICGAEVSQRTFFAHHVMALYQ